MDEAQPLNQGKGFLARLFDFSFETFITTSVIRVLYILFVVMSGLIALIWLVALAARGGAGGLIVGLVIAPIVFLLYVMVARIWLEIVIIIFRIAEDIAVIARNSERRP